MLMAYTEEMSRMDTVTRIHHYGPNPTARQRRRIVKKAGRDLYAVVYRDDGMGYPPSMQGYREVVEARLPDADEARLPDPDEDQPY